MTVYSDSVKPVEDPLAEAWLWAQEANKFMQDGRVDHPYTPVMLQGAQAWALIAIAERLTDMGSASMLTEPLDAVRSAVRDVAAELNAGLNQ